MLPDLPFELFLCHFRELLADALVHILSACHQNLAKGLDGYVEEHSPVLEHEVLSQGQSQLLFHSRSNHKNLHPMELLDPSNEVVGIISMKVWKQIAI